MSDDPKIHGDAALVFARIANRLGDFPAALESGGAAARHFELLKNWQAVARAYCARAYAQTFFGDFERASTDLACAAENDRAGELTLVFDWIHGRILRGESKNALAAAHFEQVCAELSLRQHPPLRRGLRTRMGALPDL